MNIKYRIRTLYATAAELASDNPVLLEGEWGTESDTGSRKVGNGVDDWVTLPYWDPGAAGGAVQDDDPRLSDPREWTAATVDQAEAEAGTATTRRAWTAQRVFQAVAAWWAASAASTKLAGIATGATANSSDAALLDRANHTGTQAAITITMSTARLLGRSTASAGAVEEITLGTGLSFTGTTLNAAGGSPGGSTAQLQFNNAGAFAGDSGLTFDPTTGKLTVGGKTVTTSQPILDLSQTWNNGATTFTGLKLNVTDTASASGSRLLDIQVGGVSRAFLSRAGTLDVRNSTGTQLHVGPSASNGFFVNMQDTSFGRAINLDNTYGAVSFWLSNNGRATGFAISGSGLPSFFCDDPNADFSISVARGVTIQPDNGSVLLRPSNGLTQLQRSVTGQALQVFRTWTDANNYERVELDCSTNTFRFGPRALGTGTARVLYLETGSTTVANLASAATVGTGARAFVTDATATTFASVVAGGGSNRVPVYSDGTDWRIG